MIYVTMTAKDAAKVAEITLDNVLAGQALLGVLQATKSEDRVRIGTNKAGLELIQAYENIGMIDSAERE